ncbi:MAG TPA: hypothetical protein DCG85_02490 [Lachnospiraceae bacterium]|nr:hypothetical protein [Lachnospiraceae bacterium]
MTSKTIPAGTVIYESMKDTVSTLDIIARGVVRASGDYSTIDLAPGSVIGIGELPGQNYVFSYEVAEEATIYSYPYESEASLVALLKGNPKLLSALVAMSVRYAKNMQGAVLDTLEFVRNEYERLKADLGEYPSVAILAGITPKPFEELNAFGAPEILDKARGWHRDFVEDLYENEAKFKKEFYSIPSIGLGIGLSVNSYALESRDFMLDVMAYMDELTRLSKEFKSDWAEAKEKASATMEEIANGVDGSEQKEDKSDDSIKNCLNEIRKFASPEITVYSAFSSALDSFKNNPDRYGNADETRKLRRDLSNLFYDIYLAVFLKAYKTRWDDIPIGVRMFLLFGFVDDKLAGADNTKKLSAIASSISIGGDKKIVTMYEWLRLIYEDKVVPSRNEFDLDYPAYLKEQKKEGHINEAKEKQLLTSMIDRLKFEIKNLFMIGNRITFGRITTCVPVFDKENVYRQLDSAYLSADAINTQIEKIRKIDFTAFCRQSVFSMPEAGINSLFTTQEVLPYVILMPNTGTRASLWQEIDSKKRNTPARMIISIIHMEDIEDTMIRLVGEFRWEMCKTEHGIHWNDITDPSLTSCYSDYLQFYRKNSKLSPEVREKISMALKSNANSFKKVFISDYTTYIKYESKYALRLNKFSRELLFTFCPFSKEITASLKDNPQYTELIDRYVSESAHKVKQLNNLCVKIKKAGLTVPDEIRKEIDLWTL